MRTPRFEPAAPFRLRALMLAAVALMMGLAALVLALGGYGKPPTFETVAPLPAVSADPPWPDGFVELTEPPAAASATPR